MWKRQHPAENCIVSPAACKLLAQITAPERWLPCSYEFIVVPFIIVLRSSLRATGKRNVPPHSLHLAASTPRTRNQRTRANKATNNGSICQMKRMPKSLQPQTRSSFDRFRRGATKYPSGPDRGTQAARY